MSCNWNEYINWRASLVPAAAVIPAPIAYIKVVAVKKLVVEFLGVLLVPLRWRLGAHPSLRPCSGRKARVEPHPLL